MQCPFCKHPDTRVVDSRVSEDGTSTRRRRACVHCEKRFSTVETALLSVIKRSGVTEPFMRDKVIKGVRAACRGRDVHDDELHILAQHVEEAIRSLGLAEVPSNEIGLAILGPLRDLDKVAYIRFASVYQSFNSLTDFEDAINILRDQQK